MKLTKPQWRLLTESARSAKRTLISPTRGLRSTWGRVASALDAKGLGTVWLLPALDRHAFTINEAGLHLLAKCHPKCPGWLHSLSDDGFAVERCDECHANGVGFETDDAAQAAHDSVCACSLNERTRKRLSARQADTVPLLPSQDEWGDFEIRTVKF